MVGATSSGSFLVSFFNFLFKSPSRMSVNRYWCCRNIQLYMMQFQAQWKLCYIDFLRVPLKKITYKSSFCQPTLLLKAVTACVGGLYCTSMPQVPRVRLVTGQLADTPTRGLPTRGLDISRTGQLADSQMPPKERKLSTQSRRWHPRVVQSASWQSASWRIRELSSNRTIDCVVLEGDFGQNTRRRIHVRLRKN